MNLPSGFRPSPHSGLLTNIYQSHQMDEEGRGKRMNISTRLSKTRRRGDMRMTKQTRAHVEWVARAHWQFPDTKAAPPTPHISYSIALLNTITLSAYYYYLYYPQLEWSSTERECDHLVGEWTSGYLQNTFRKASDWGIARQTDNRSWRRCRKQLHRQNQFRIEVITILNNNLVHFLG